MSPFAEDFVITYIIYYIIYIFAALNNNTWKYV